MSQINLEFYLDEAITQIKKQQRKNIRYAPKAKLEKTSCPRCGKKANTKKQVKKLFGFRLTGNTVRVQSWCRVCRWL